MRAELCAATVENTVAAYPGFCGAVLTTTAEASTQVLHTKVLNEYGVKQSMNSAADITRTRLAYRRPPQWNNYPLCYMPCCSKLLSEMCKAVLTILMCSFDLSDSTHKLLSHTTSNSRLSIPTAA